MITISDITRLLEQLAPVSLQESYDKSGLTFGNPEQLVTGVYVSLDATEKSVEKAASLGCNLLVTHHPLLFEGISHLNQQSPTHRTLIAAIKLNVALYAIHTNLDQVDQGVNKALAQQLELTQTTILRPLRGRLLKLVTFAPVQAAPEVQQALFDAGAGQVGQYDRCSFNVEGTGTFRAGEGANPFVGEIGSIHREQEIRIEVLLPDWLESTVLRALVQAHPYEEVAYDVYRLSQAHEGIGAGMIGRLPEPLVPEKFLEWVSQKLQAGIIRHSALPPKNIHKVAICGGSGSFLLPDALKAGADAFLTADLKYHQFFDAGPLLLADIGHFESEQFAIGLLIDYLKEKLLNFAPQLPILGGLNTNPVKYYNHGRS